MSKDANEKRDDLYPQKPVPKPHNSMVDKTHSGVPREDAGKSQKDSDRDGVLNRGGVKKE